MERQVSCLIAQIKQVGARILERTIAEKHIDAFNCAQGRILYILHSEQKFKLPTWCPYQ